MLFDYFWHPDMKLISKKAGALSLYPHVLLIKKERHILLIKMKASTEETGFKLLL